MRKFIGLVVVLVVIALGVMYATQQTSAAIGKLDILQGSAEIVTGDKATPARTGADLRQEDTVRVAPGGRVTVILNDGCLLYTSDAADE